jgi:hypothetical protein
MSLKSDRGFFHYRRTAFSSMLNSRVGNILAKASGLHINLNIDGSPIASKSHTHPSHSKTSRLLTKDSLRDRTGTARADVWSIHRTTTRTV